MCDKLEFRIFDAKDREDWADIYEKDECHAVDIYINGEEICSILKKIERSQDDTGNLAGDYGHREPRWLYSDLKEALVEGTYNYKYGVELLCCSSCGEEGCWSVMAKVKDDGEFIYWKDFHHNHRDWVYNLSYKFDKQEYEAQMKKMNSFPKSFE